MRCRVAALERVRNRPEEYVLTRCMIRQDACSSPPNVCSCGDCFADDRANVVDLHRRSGSRAAKSQSESL